MKMRTLPGTSLMVPELCLGTMMFGGQTCEADSLAIMGYAYEQGLNFWDTADVYNHGESERIVGKGLKGRRGNIVLATKVGSDMGDGPNARGLSRYHIVASVEDSLRRLGTDYLDIYYLHTPDYGTRMEETLDTMATLVRAGKIRYVGVSNYAAWQMADMLSICEKNGGVKPVITQNVYNLITRGIEAELVPFLTRHEIGMVVYNPIAAGLLVGKHKREAPQQNTRFANNKNYYDRYWAEENFDAVDKLAAIAAEAGVGLLELSMKWCLAQKGVTSVITGVSRLEQLEQNIASVKGETLDERTIDRCNAVWDVLPVGSRFAYNR